MSENQANTLLNASVLKNKHKRNIAINILVYFQECVTKLNMRQLLSISMDGPNVNLKLADLLQTEHVELYGAHLVNVGSCGLHTLHNALKAGFTMWQMDKLLRALHYLFHNVPARREDFTALTGSYTFPLPFCGHRWVESGLPYTLQKDLAQNVCAFILQQ